MHVNVIAITKFNTSTIKTLVYDVVLNIYMYKQERHEPFIAQLSKEVNYNHYSKKSDSLSLSKCERRWFLIYATNQVSITE